mmetsp:Transcript_20191/g.29307  ORF Transcript_20191/g.29307 Transcript_20191/m.29307 type:complete len:86 (+) Transcript_20191:173-430(+)
MAWSSFDLRVAEGIEALPQGTGRSAHGGELFNERLCLKAWVREQKHHMLVCGTSCARNPGISEKSNWLKRHISGVFVWKMEGVQA